MRCPFCGTEMNVSEVPSTYIWNKGLPKAFCSKDWLYYTCEKCYNERQRGKKKKLFCFAFLPDNTYLWDESSHKWKKLNIAVNPSRRDSLEEEEIPNE